MKRPAGKPSMERRGGDPPARGYVPPDSMKQGAFAAKGKNVVMMTPDESMSQGGKVRPGKIAPKNVPRVRGSMHQ